MSMIQKVKDLWTEFSTWHDEMQWQNSRERRELAVERISQLRAFMAGESDFNPYEHLYTEQVH